MTKNKFKQKQSFTFQMLYYWGKILGINPLTLSNNNVLEFSYLNLFYGCFLGATYSFVFYRSLIERVKLHSLGETPVAIIANYIGIGCQFAEISLTWFIFAIYQTRIKCLVKSMLKAVKSSRKLGISEDYDRNLNKFAINIAINNLVYLASLTFSTTLLIVVQPYNPIIWVSFNLPRIVSFNMGILFIGSLVFVKQKFRRLNDRVKSLMDNSTVKIVYEKPYSGLIRNSSCNPAVISNRIKMVAQLHRELRNIMHRIEEHFASPVLFSIGNYMVSIATIGYVIYQRFKELNQVVGMDLALHIGALNHWFTYPVIILIELSSVCGSTSDEANKTGNIFHGMLNNCKSFIDTREYAKLNVFSLDLLKNQVSISLFGLIELNNYFIHRIFGTVIMYFTIMLQFYN